MATQNTDQSLPVTINISPDELRDHVVVTVEGRDFIRPLAYFGISFDETERNIIAAVAPTIREEFNVDITDYYKVRKAVNSQNIHIIPNSVAG